MNRHNKKVLVAFFLVFLVIQLFYGILAFCAWPAYFVVAIIFGIDVYTMYVVVKNLKELKREDA